jgi:hypothetical protein
MKRLWSDESGAVLSVELILLLVLVVFGIGVGLTVLRDAVLVKLCDVANAIGALDTSYAFYGLTYTSVIDGADVSSTASTVHSMQAPLDFTATSVLASTDPTY